MRKRDDKIYLVHILECISRVEKEAAQGAESFFSDYRIQDIVLRNLQILTESTQRISESLKSKSPETNWARISAFRNRLVHDYLGVNLEIIWNTVQKDIPALKSAIQKMLKDMETKS